MAKQPDCCVLCSQQVFDSGLSCLQQAPHVHMPSPPQQRLICTSTCVKPFWFTSDCCRALSSESARHFRLAQTQWTENVIVMFWLRAIRCARLDTNNKSHDHAKTMHNNSKNENVYTRNLQGKQYLRLSLLHTGTYHNAHARTRAIAAIHTYCARKYQSA